MNWLGLAADTLGVLSAVFALFAWIESRKTNREIRREQQRQNRKIDIILSHGSQTVKLPVSVRRNDLTRAEVLGRIGMIPLKQGPGRFFLEYPNTPEFLRRIDEIAQAQGDSVLQIPCTQQEIDQFKLNP